jgi:homoaconitase/3-isopropylmalate dehydratase large subunit
MLALEAMGLDRVRTELSAQYVDHNILQVDNLNADDHAFLESACRRFGVWYSRPGNGISHVIHASVGPAHHCLDRTVTPRLLALWECWRSAPADWTLLWR